MTRRPTTNVLLKSPSMDSESSDPIISGLGSVSHHHSHHHHHHHHGRQPKISGAAKKPREIKEFNFTSFFLA